MPHASTDLDEVPALLHLESLGLTTPTGPSWPSFTRDSQSRHSFFVTHDEGVSHVNLSPWVEKLAEEFNCAGKTGADFRMGLLVESNHSEVLQAIKFQRTQGETGPASAAFSACINLLDSDLGNVLLSMADGRVEAANLETSDFDIVLKDGMLDGIWEEDLVERLPIESRATYQPPRELWSESTLTSLMDSHMSSLDKRAMQDEIRLSSSNLKLMMEAHRILSHETHQLGAAAADLFRRCERLREEFEEQIKRVNQVADRIDSVLDEDIDAYQGFQEERGTSANIERRVDAAKSREDLLIKRYSELRRKVGAFHGRPLTEREKVWSKEIESMKGLFPRGRSDGGDEQANDTSMPTDARLRYEQLETLRREMIEAAKDEEVEANGEEQQGTGISRSKRKARWAEINTMLEREGATIDATMARLARLRNLSMY